MCAILFCHVNTLKYNNSQSVIFIFNSNGKIHLEGGKELRQSIHPHKEVFWKDEC